FLLVFCKSFTISQIQSFKCNKELLRFHSPTSQEFFSILYSDFQLYCFDLLFQYQFLISSRRTEATSRIPITIHLPAVRGMAIGYLDVTAARTKKQTTITPICIRHFF